MKDYAYLRVSSDGQADMGFGLDLQRERITAYAKALGFEIADDCWIVDDGYTGTNLDRPGLQSLLGLVASGKVRKVVVYKIDRLSRSQRRLLEVIEDHLDKNGVAFVSVMEQFDTSTPFGRACLGMLGVFAQLDRDMLVDRLVGGRVQRAKQGDRAGGALALGYTTDRNAQGRKVTVIDESEAKVVRMIFDMNEKGKSLREIAKLINAKGYRTKRGCSFFAATIRDVLNRSMYTGTVSQRVNGQTIVSRNSTLTMGVGRS